MSRVDSASPIAVPAQLTGGGSGSLAIST